MFSNPKTSTSSQSSEEDLWSLVKQRSLDQEGEAALLELLDKAYTKYGFKRVNKSDTEEKDEKTLLMHAVTSDNSPAIKWLKGKKVSLQERDQEGKTALMHAVISKQSEKVVQLVIYPGWCRTLCKSNRNAFDYALENENLVAVEVVSQYNKNEMWKYFGSEKIFNSLVNVVTEKTAQMVAIVCRSFFASEFYDAADDGYYPPDMGAYQLAIRSALERALSLRNVRLVKAFYPGAENCHPEEPTKILTAQVLNAVLDYPQDASKERYELIKYLLRLSDGNFLKKVIEEAFQKHKKWQKVRPEMLEKALSQNDISMLAYMHTQSSLENWLTNQPEKIYELLSSSEGVAKKFTLIPFAKKAIKILRDAMGLLEKMELENKKINKENKQEGDKEKSDKEKRQELIKNLEKKTDEIQVEYQAVLYAKKAAVAEEQMNKLRQSLADLMQHRDRNLTIATKTKNEDIVKKYEDSRNRLIKQADALSAILSGQKQESKQEQNVSLSNASSFFSPSNCYLEQTNNTATLSSKGKPGGKLKEKDSVPKEDGIDFSDLADDLLWPS